jgi:NitT/TauT family transport system substrate-binding protein
LAGIVCLTTAASLAACSGDGDSDDLDPDNPTHAAVQLGWNPNVENMATVVAQQKGFFTEEGIDADILPGGPEVAADAQVVSGNADMAVLTSESLANAVASGAPLVAIGAIYQKSPSTILTKEGSGINEPKDLEGKKFGVSQSDQRVYKPFLTSAGVDLGKIDMIDTGADPASLVSGEVDAMSAVAPNQPVVLRQQGVDTKEIMLADYGFARWSGALTVRKADLEDSGKRAKIMAMARAVEKGLETSVSNPEDAGTVVYDSYAKDLGLSLESQKEGARIWADLATSAHGRTTGIALVDDDGVKSQQAFFDESGIKGTASELYDVDASKEAFGNE